MRQRALLCFLCEKAQSADVPQVVLHLLALAREASMSCKLAAGSTTESLIQLAVTAVLPVPRSKDKSSCDVSSAWMQVAVTADALTKLIAATFAMA